MALHDKLANCPECEGGDVRFCEISVRPHCGDCHHWAPVNYGTKADAIALWNSASNRKGHPPMTPYTPEQRADLAKRIEARAQKLWDKPERPTAIGVSPHQRASVLADIAREIRDGSFFEVQHD